MRRGSAVGQAVIGLGLLIIGVGGLVGESTPEFAVRIAGWAIFISGRKALMLRISF